MCFSMVGPDTCDGLTVNGGMRRCDDEHAPLATRPLSLCRCQLLLQKGQLRVADLRKQRAIVIAGNGVGQSRTGTAGHRFRRCVAHSVKNNLARGLNLLRGRRAQYRRQIHRSCAAS
jgi:hypothetical protein